MNDHRSQYEKIESYGKWTTGQKVFAVLFVLFVLLVLLPLLRGGY